MSRVEELENEIKGLENRKLELLKQLELEKLTQKIEIPFKTGNEYFVIEGSGRVISKYWTPETYHTETFLHGNAFHSEQEAERERDKRILLTQFKQFRDKCNGDWKPGFNSWEANKYYVSYSYSSDDLSCFTVLFNTHFQPFGYFKNKEDCQRAIELFGDEIKRLYVEVEQ